MGFMKYNTTTVKPKDIKQTLEQLQQESRDEIKKADGKRQDLQAKINQEYLAGGFFFSVVFASQSERDEWCIKNHLKLKDDEYILAKDFDIKIQRKV